MAHSEKRTMKPCELEEIQSSVVSRRTRLNRSLHCQERDMQLLRRKYYLNITSPYRQNRNSFFMYQITLDRNDMPFHKSYQLPSWIFLSSIFKDKYLFRCSQKLLVRDILDMGYVSHESIMIGIRHPGIRDRIHVPCNRIVQYN